MSDFSSRFEKSERAMQQLRGEVESLRGQLAELRAEMDQQREAIFEIVSTALGQYGDKIHDYVDAAMKRLESAFWTAIESRNAELSARLDLLPDGKPRATSDFKFANERERDDDEITELPNPLPPRRAIN
jgi:hypothetical protein